MNRRGSADGCFAADFIERPYWLDDVEFDVPTIERLPAQVDVLIIGAGYTGAAAASVTVGAGRSTLLIDAQAFGRGCSAQNGGQVATSIKPSVAALVARLGREQAHAIHEEGLEALEGLRTLIRDEEIDCEWQSCGRFVGAHTARSFKSLLASARAYADTFAQAMTVVPRDELRREIGTEQYYGGIVQPQHAAVQPAKLHRALLLRAETDGAALFDECKAISIIRDAHSFRVLTNRGPIVARDVVIATDGYTGSLSPWHRRRVIPIRTSVLATEPLPDGMMDRLLPTRRNVVDTRRLVIYFRPSPDGRRIIFGGRAGLFNMPSRVYVPRLLGWLRDLFPDLATVRASRAWSGVVAYTFDALPHLGQHEGVHFCMGYCGSGVSLSVHLGRKIGLRVIGDPASRTALDNLPFQTRPMYFGNPWFLAPSVALFRTLDAAGL